MGRQSPVSMTLSLLGIMAAVAIISAIVGYRVGALALIGVTQPEANPAKKFADSNYDLEDPQAFQPLDEKKIIDRVNHTILRTSRAFKTHAADSSRQASLVASSEQPSSEGSSASFPLHSQADGVTLSVNGIEKTGDSLVLAIRLQNNGDRSRRFLYSFLELENERGTSLGGITKGLPEEIPANKQVFSGQIEIPQSLLQENQKLTLTLSDYPDRTLTLSIKNIPINL